MSGAEAAPPSPSADADVVGVADAATGAVAEAEANADVDAEAEDPVLKDYYFLKGRRASLATSAMVEFVMTIAGKHVLRFVFAGQGRAWCGIVWYGMVWYCMEPMYNPCCFGVCICMIVSILLCLFRSDFMSFLLWCASQEI